MSKPHTDPQILLDEVRASKTALDTSLAGLRQAVSPSHQAARLTHNFTRGPAFPVAIVAIVVLTGASILATVHRRRRDEKSWRHLPEKLAEALHLRHEKPTQPTGKQQRLLKAAGSIALKAATPILLGVLKHQFSAGKTGTRSPY